ncbi:MAG: exosortase Q [Azoarcus sp.]|jgi:exosortase/archaeosortase family protein|nr:exosortase Q [Azoarcus sp.]
MNMSGIDRCPPAVWLALLGAAIWPHILWMARRMLDGSDDPLGVVALAALAFAGWRQRGRLRRAPRPTWFCAALLLVALAGAAWQTLPPLFAALLALTGFAAGMLALFPSGIASVPVLGLAALSLPLMASLQFYAGYPLRLMAAEFSRWLLLAGHRVERDGVALRVDGQLVLVDAACSGVQLVWLGYFTACAAALLTGCDNRRFLRRLPVVGALVLAGNVLRSTALVALQADGMPVAAWLHEGIGLLTLAIVCALVFRLMRNREDIDRNNGAEPPFPGMRRFKLLAALLLPACALSGIDVRNAHAENAAAPIADNVEWPATWRGQRLRPLALSEVERRFARGFPGRIARLTDDRDMLVWRYVARPTRMLHPAADCYRALGWRIRDERLEQVENDRQSERWRCFIAEQARVGARLRGCERIEVSSGQEFTDTSAWYWAAVTGQSRGPWQAVTVASALP